MYHLKKCISEDGLIYKQFNIMTMRFDHLTKKGSQSIGCEPFF
jgi:hypothetical protein